MTIPMPPYQGSYLTPSFDDATVADAMHPGVMTCPPEASAVSVARMMATHHVHAIVVEGIGPDAYPPSRRVWGIVSDLDLTRAAASGNAEDLTAAELAATEPVTIDVTAPLAEAARTMDEHGTAHLIVVDRRRPVGMLSTLDVAGALAWGRG